MCLDGESKSIIVLMNMWFEKKILPTSLTVGSGININRAYNVESAQLNVKKKKRFKYT